LLGVPIKIGTCVKKAIVSRGGRETGSNVVGDNTEVNLEIASPIESEQTPIS
jgi:hypothetical protein